MPRNKISIGYSVSGWLTDDERAELARGIRAARASYDAQQDDDWLCCILQHGVAPSGLGKREEEVTDEDLTDTCVDLAGLMHEPDWNRALGVFGPYRERVAAVFAAAESGGIPPNPPVHQHPDLDRFDVGAAVFTALTDAERDELADTIRNARLSYLDEKDQGDDWLCIMMQHDTEPQGMGKRKRLVTRADLLMTCVDLAQLRLTAGFDWRRILRAFDQHERRVDYLFKAAAQGMIPARPALVLEARRLAAGEA